MQEQVGTVKIKALMMALTIISSISLILSLLSAKEFLTVFPTSFTFFASNALVFYGTKEGRKNYMTVIKICFCTLIIDFGLLLVSDFYKAADIFCLWTEKITFIPLAVLVVVATVRINANTEVDFDKKAVD
ncbi:hypothetical protein N42HA_01177 [Lactococcus lactis]|uniref:Uncharacterized protein n=1 Tax=Lactococcus lactis subsp. lactis TaxID=1360 RepID=A0A0V8EJ22_LACLL|nr:hypothetical protein [Lactococcus lactis]KSU25615.1 hypothetical protein N42_2050 [Lactococcus lactis subsp. lactis]MCT3138101.1 hypothetical protein [Lactococcus lactis]MDU0408167.1 hypothetical protein [Lactococcus lactis]